MNKYYIWNGYADPDMFITKFKRPSWWFNFNKKENTTMSTTDSPRGSWWRRLWDAMTGAATRVFSSSRKAGS